MKPASTGGNSTGMHSYERQRRVHDRTTRNTPEGQLIAWVRAHAAEIERKIRLRPMITTTAPVSTFVYRSAAPGFTIDEYERSSPDLAVLISLTVRPVPFGRHRRVRRRFPVQLNRVCGRHGARPLVVRLGLDHELRGEIQAKRNKNETLERSGVPFLPRNQKFRPQAS